MCIRDRGEQDAPLEPGDAGQGGDLLQLELLHAEGEHQPLLADVGKAALGGLRAQQGDGHQIVDRSGAVSYTHLYHQYGMVKYQQLERRYPLSDSVMPILPARQKEILALFQRCGLNAQLGG